MMIADNPNYPVAPPRKNYKETKSFSLSPIVSIIIIITIVMVFISVDKADEQRTERIRIQYDCTKKLINQ